MTIYRTCKIQTDYVEIKFVDLILTSTLLNTNFQTYNMSIATPAALVNPFKTIDLTRDYDSISRTLFLWWTSSSTLSDNTDYELRIDNLLAVNGYSIASEIIAFSTGVISTEVATDLDQPPTKIPTIIEDYSVKSIETFISTVDLDDATVLSIESLTPDIDSRYYLAPTTAEGRIDIHFNQTPAANFISSDYFKIQRKSVSRQMSRWETVSALVTADTINDIVYIYLPSTDATPVYGEPNKDYWEIGFKYKLTIVAGIGI